MKKSQAYFKRKPLISVIVANYNGKKWLTECFESIFKQKYSPLEVILVDNASSDGSVEFARSNYPQIKVIQAKENLGFAGGNNLGFEMSSGKYILFLNNDVNFSENLIAELFNGMQKNKGAGCLWPKIRLMEEPEKLDMCGSYWTNSTLLYHEGYKKRQDKKNYNQPRNYFSAKGAALLMPRSVIEEAGLFDGDFWCFYEETDFCHRLWLSGYECLYWPEAEIFHAVGGTSVLQLQSYLQYHNFKNKLCSFLKNFEGRTLIRVLPIFFLVNAFLWCYWILTFKWANSFALCRAWWWNLSHLKETLKKRKGVQQWREVSDKDVFRQTQKNPPFKYYYYLLTGLEKYKN
ncbi:MAG: glycosyltransferase family 2 protein [Candidatus Moranbacteria bacterium]|nr:glycosyltransferase family 2 protein [Candidatus Moranbacteria bacterium]